MIKVYCAISTVVILVLLVFVFRRNTKQPTYSNEPTFKTNVLFLSDAIQFAGVVMNYIGNKNGILKNFVTIVESMLDVTCYVVLINYDTFEVISSRDVNYSEMLEGFVNLIYDKLHGEEDVDYAVINSKECTSCKFLQKHSFNSLHAVSIKDTDLKGFIVLCSKQDKYFDVVGHELALLGEYISTVLITSENYSKIEFLATKDFLTGLYNRLSLKDNYSDCLLKSKESGMLSLAMFDIDYFKKVNDTYGHLSGDLVLKQIAFILKTQVNDDFVCRYGGEEFLIVFPGQTKDQAYEKVENIRSVVESTKLKIIDGEIRKTISAGLYTCTDIDEKLEDIIKKADENLYQAKETGRNKIIFS